LVSQGLNSFVNSGIIAYIISRTIIDTPTNELNRIGRPIVSWRITGSRLFRESRKEITISFALSLETLADSGELIYPLVVTGEVSMDGVRRIMGEAALLHNIQEPPMKYVLCRENSLADMITNTRALENVEGVKSVEISLNLEVLVSTHLRHSLITEGNYEEDGKESSGLTLHRLRFQTRKNLALRVLIDRVTNFVSQQIVHYP
jgi:copper chaperone CopZ